MPSHYKHWHSPASQHLLLASAVFCFAVAAAYLAKPLWLFGLLGGDSLSTYHGRYLVLGALAVIATLGCVALRGTAPPEAVAHLDTTSLVSRMELSR